MGLFGKKEACPVCGGEVKGLFPKKIGGKKALCKECGKYISMKEELRKEATPKYAAKHIERRKASEPIFKNTSWEKAGFWGQFHVGINRELGLIYLESGDMDNLDLPSIFTFDAIKGYELYRNKKLVDSANEPGETMLNTTGGGIMSALGILTDNDDNRETFHFKLKIDNEYWPEVDLKYDFTDQDLFGTAGTCDRVQLIGQVFKRIVRKEEVPMLHDC